MNNSKVVLVSLFYYEINDNIRISNVYKLLKDRGTSVELITTDFNHRYKTKHAFNENSDITFINVPEYKKNLSLKRLYSHIIFAIRLYKYFNNLKYKPSKVYCIVPAVTSGFVCNLFCKKRNIPFIIDIIDLWPESFIILSKYKWILELITLPWSFIARKVYKSADIIFAESEYYAKYAQIYNSKIKAKNVYLGTDINKTKLLISESNLKIEKPSNEIWISYGGNLGNSYDFDILLESFKKLNNIGFTNIKLIFIGDGEYKFNILDYKNKFNLPIEVSGFLTYPDFLKYLSYSDIAINSFKKGTKVAFSYKFNDYISCGLPVLNNLLGETADIIDKYHIGLNFDYNEATLYDRLLYLLRNPENIAEMKKNVLFVAEQVFDKGFLYKEMIDILVNKI
jgi:hypothetical protein